MERPNNSTISGQGLEEPPQSCEPPNRGPQTYFLDATGATHLGALHKLEAKGRAESATDVRLLRTDFSEYEEVPCNRERTRKDSLPAHKEEEEWPIA